MVLHNYDNSNIPVFDQYCPKFLTGMLFSNPMTIYSALDISAINNQ
jgi:hypothetical protein